MNYSDGSAPIFLTGFMGTGKSTIGRLMAHKTGYPFIELDNRIEQESKSGISEIFEKSGEDGFRQIETKVLRGLDLRGKCIIATGGGTPVFHENMEWMKSQGTVIHLQCRPGVLFHRLSPEKSARPLLSKLTDIELMGFIIDVLKSRLPFYNQADLHINGEKNPEEVVNEILEKLKSPITNS